MASINQMFASMLSEGITASKAISDPEKKAQACAELAKALAMTGLVSVGGSESANAATPEEEKESLKEKAKPKQKATAKKEKAPAAEEPKEEAAEEAASEVEVTDEWTEEMLEQFSEQLATIEQLQEEYDEETLDECVKNFSEGVLNGIEDISPLNIDGFIAYIQMLLSDAEAE
ncbi:hypothetical protein [Bacillus atrophaeus]|uniref:hypothetical protein n=1 Tax=Bacillus atrophaeus TaxID=1452 RepID=UPI002E1F9D68|nr:hypothetical protein [Bacillus atrophaeus]